METDLEETFSTIETTALGILSKVLASSISGTIN